MKTRIWLSLILILNLYAGSALGAVWSDGFEDGDPNVPHWNPGWSDPVKGRVANILGVLTPHSGNYMATTGWDIHGIWGTRCTNTFATPWEGYTLTGYMALTGDKIELPDYVVATIGITPSTGNSYRLSARITRDGNVDYYYGGTKNGWGKYDTVIAVGEWVRVDMYGGPEGMIIVINGQAFRNPSTGLGWDRGHDIKTVLFGSAWGTVPAGYDDFILTPGLPDMTPMNCETAIERNYGLVTDLNGDCDVTLLDWALFAQQWLDCVNPLDSGCLAPWD